jgi:predicted TIM-barrel fold metal-dependent hydrolase
LRETLTRVLRSYRWTRGKTAADPISLASPLARKADCDFDADAWDRGSATTLSAAGIGRVVLNRLPAADATPLPLAEDDQPAWRAVIGKPNDTSRPTLAALHAFGVRGIRVDVGAGAATDLEQLLPLADHIVPFDWHIELRMAAPGSARTLAKAEWLLMQFPLAVCFSGIGRLGHASRTADADLKLLLGLMTLGRYWLKLSANDLAPSQLQLWDELPPLAQALQTIRKDRLVWGSGKQMDGGGATHLASGLALLEKCLPHPGDQEQVLVDNPARLYGFGVR